MVDDLYKVFFAAFFFVLGDYMTVKGLAQHIQNLINYLQQML